MRPVIGCFSLSWSASSVKLNSYACFEKKKVLSVQVFVGRRDTGLPWKGPGKSWENPWISHQENSGNPDT